MGMKVNLPHCFKQIARGMPGHGAALEEFEKHLRETIRGEHTLQELAEFYCLTEPPYVPQTEDEARERMDNGRNTGGGKMRQ